MNESDYNQLREQSWRRKLTPAEEGELRAWLAQHSRDRMDWEADARLTALIGRLDNAPVPSNFTARLLRAVERDAASEEVHRTAPEPKWFLRSFLPRAAAAAVVLGAGLFTYREHVNQKREAMVQSVRMVSGIPSLPSPEILQDLDTIQQISIMPGPDPEIIALMK